MTAQILFFIVYLILNSLLVWHDSRYCLLPDRFTCPLLWIGLLYSSCFNPSLLQEKVIGAMAGYAGFTLLYWGYRLVRGHEGLGFGDVKFLASLGAWHGWAALPLLVFVAASLACGAACFLVFKSGSIQILKKPLPFGPFLATAGLITSYQTLFFLVDG